MTDYSTTIQGSVLWLSQTMNAYLEQRVTVNELHRVHLAYQTLQDLIVTMHPPDVVYQTFLGLIEPRESR